MRRRQRAKSGEALFRPKVVPVYCICACGCEWIGRRVPVEDRVYAGGLGTDCPDCAACTLCDSRGYVVEGAR